MILTAEQVLAVMPTAGGRIRAFLDPINDALARFGIDTEHEVASWLAQIADESQELHRTVENLNYSWQGLLATWPKRFTVELAHNVERQPEKIANIVYANRMGNGSPESGEGYRFRGRGLIQITGKNNYRACADAIGVNLLQEPERLGEPEYAALSAGWFWQANGLDAYDDDDEVGDETRIINGGEIGLAQRQAYLDKALKVLA